MYVIVKDILKKCHGGTIKKIVSGLGGRHRLVGVAAAVVVVAAMVVVVVPFSSSFVQIWSPDKHGLIFSVGDD